MRSLITLLPEDRHARTAVLEFVNRSGLASPLVAEASPKALEDAILDLDSSDGPALPLDADEAAKALATLGGDRRHLSFLLYVDQEQYMLAYAIGRQTEGADDEHDLCHSLVLSFGLPYDCSTEIVATDGDSFLVLYTTDVREALVSSEG